jgi:tetratricopeptide (TPR) repeat protein
MAAAAAFGDYSLVVPALQASERDLPNDYNPPSRLATVYAQLGRIDDALAANQRAVAKAPPGRRVLLLASRATLYEKKGDNVAAKQALEEALKQAEAQPGQQRTVERLKKQLETYHAK